MNGELRVQINMTKLKEYDVRFTSDNRSEPIFFLLSVMAISPFDALEIAIAMARETDRGFWWQVVSGKGKYKVAIINYELSYFVNFDVEMGDHIKRG